MSEAEQIERKEIGRIKLSDAQELVAFVADDKKRWFSVNDIRLSMINVTPKKEPLILFVFKKIFTEPNRYGLLHHLVFRRRRWKLLVQWVLRKILRNEMSKTNIEAAITEIYVLQFFPAWIVLLIIFSILQTQWWMYIVLFFAGARILEIVTHHIYRLFLPAQSLKPHSHRRSIMLLFFNYVEILFCFALFYNCLSFLFQNQVFQHPSLNSFLGSLYFSLVTMSTLGYGDVVPRGGWGAVLVCIQVLVGLFMGIWLLTRVISFLPKPRSRDSQEQ